MVLFLREAMRAIASLGCPTHKRTEGRAPVWGSEFTSKRRRTTGGDPAETAASAFYDFVQMYVHHVQMRVQTRRLAHGPFQLAVH